MEGLVVWLVYTHIRITEANVTHLGDVSYQREVF